MLNVVLMRISEGVKKIAESTVPWTPRYVAEKFSDGSDIDEPAIELSAEEPASLKISPSSSRFSLRVILNIHITAQVFFVIGATLKEFNFAE